MDYEKMRKDLGQDVSDWSLSRYPADYNAWKRGWCSDLEYFQYQFAGQNGTVIKKKHPFSLESPQRELFYVRRPYTSGYGEQYVEFKIYDIDGKLVHKRTYRPGIRGEASLAARSVSAFWKEAQYGIKVYYYIDFKNEEFYMMHKKTSHPLSCREQFVDREKKRKAALKQKKQQSKA